MFVLTRSVAILDLHARLARLETSSPLAAFSAAVGRRHGTFKGIPMPLLLNNITRR